MHIKDCIASSNNNGRLEQGGTVLRWEFRLSQDVHRRRSRWAWTCRDAGGRAVCSTATFDTYRECIRDAMRHGYRIHDVPCRDSGLIGSSRSRLPHDP